MRPSAERPWSCSHERARLMQWWVYVRSTNVAGEWCALVRIKKARWPETCGHEQASLLQCAGRCIWSTGVCALCVMCRVGQNHIYTVYIRYFWLGNHQIYGVYIHVYTVLANPSYVYTSVPTHPPYCNLIMCLQACLCVMCYEYTSVHTHPPYCNLTLCVYKRVCALCVMSIQACTHIHLIATLHYVFTSVFVRYVLWVYKRAHTSTLLQPYYVFTSVFVRYVLWVYKRAHTSTLLQPYFVFTSVPTHPPYCLTHPPYCHLIECIVGWEAADAFIFISMPDRDRLLMHAGVF